MDNEMIPDRLLACTMCAGVFRWTDDRLTVAEHAVGRRTGNPECPGSGTEGIDLGERARYWMEPDGTLVHRGVGHREPQIEVVCSCKDRASVPAPPDGAFDRRLKVAIQCRSCETLLLLGELQQGPQGSWMPRVP